MAQNFGEIGMEVLPSASAKSTSPLFAIERVGSTLRIENPEHGLLGYALRFAGEGRGGSRLAGPEWTRGTLFAGRELHVRFRYNASGDGDSGRRQ